MTTQNTELSRLEKEAFRKFYDDGLFDVFLGFVLLLMPITTILESWISGEIALLAAIFVLYMVPAVALKYFRMSLLRNRLGTFEPSPERKKKTRAVRIALSLSVLLGLVLFVVTGVMFSTGSVEFAQFIPLVWFLNATFVLGAMGYYLDVPRFIAYGPLLGSTLPALLYPDLLWDITVSVWVVFGIPAVIILSVGIYKFVHFLRDYPVRTNEMATHG